MVSNHSDNVSSQTLLDHSVANSSNSSLNRNMNDSDVNNIACDSSVSCDTQLNSVSKSSNQAMKEIVNGASSDISSSSDSSKCVDQLSSNVVTMDDQKLCCGVPSDNPLLKEGTVDQETVAANSNQNDANITSNNVTVNHNVERKMEITSNNHESSTKVQLSDVKVKDDSMHLRPMANVLFNIGQGLVLQSAYQQKLHRLKRKKSSKIEPKLKETNLKFKKEYENLSNKLKRFKLELHNCKGCRFQTDVNNVMELHKEYGHGQDDAQYKCAFCQYSTFRESEYIFHVEAEHNRLGRIQVRKSAYECPLCPYESRNSVVYNKHLLQCKKSYNQKRNLEPLFTDSDIPIKKTKQDRIAAKENAAANHSVTPIVPISGLANVGNINLKPQIQLSNVRPRGQLITVPNNAVQATVKSKSPRAQTITMPSKSVVLSGSAPPPRLVQIGNQWYSLVPSADKAQYTAVPVTSSTGPVMPSPRFSAPVSISRPENSKASSAFKQPSNLSSGFNSAQIDSMESIINAAVAAAIAGNTQNKQSVLPSPIVIAPTTGKSSISNVNHNRELYEVCEICDGFVKDRDALRAHFEISHKIKIDVKMLEQRQPILGCLKCSKRFWTYQGLSKHSKHEHGTATSQPAVASQSLPAQRPIPSPQVAATALSNFPTYTCSICGEKRIRFVLSHLKGKHRINVPDILAMKQCPCCGLGCSSPESVFVHIEATHPEVIGDPALKMYQISCQFCLTKFTSAAALEAHCNSQHSLLCSYCDERFSEPDFLNKHVATVHQDEERSCPVCDDEFPIGSAYTQHITATHLRKCTVQLKRMSDGKSANDSQPENDSDHEMNVVNGTTKSEVIVELD